MEEETANDRGREGDNQREREEDRELGMKKKHRDHILKRLKELISCTHYVELMTETVRRGLFLPVMRHNIEEWTTKRLNQKNDDVLYEQHKEYFIKITQRGPCAYAELKAIFRKLKYTDALQILEEADPSETETQFLSLNRNRSTKSTDLVDTPVTQILVQAPAVSREEIVPHHPEQPRKIREVRKSDCIHQDEKLGTYPMRTQHNRGVLFMANIIDFADKKLKRNGSNHDVESLVQVFEAMGFKTFSHENLNSAKFFEELKDVTSMPIVRDTECFVLVLMTHGERVHGVDKVQFTNGSTCDVQDILEEFRPDKCQNLIGKPKVLLFPFCRGDKPDQGLTLQKQLQTDGLGVSFNNVPTLSDMLICYATTPGFETHRETDKGSWYIQDLCDILADHAHNTSFEDMLKMTQERVGRKRTGKGNLQTGSFKNFGFNKKLFFNPGFYDI